MRDVRFSLRITMLAALIASGVGACRGSTSFVDESVEPNRPLLSTGCVQDMEEEGGCLVGTELLLGEYMGALDGEGAGAPMGCDINNVFCVLREPTAAEITRLQAAAALLPTYARNWFNGRLGYLQMWDAPIMGPDGLIGADTHVFFGAGLTSPLHLYSHTVNDYNAEFLGGVLCHEYAHAASEKDHGDQTFKDAFRDCLADMVG